MDLLIKFRIGGMRTLFTDFLAILYFLIVWGHSIKVIFPELYCIARDKEAFVNAHVQPQNDSIQWEVNFIRAPHDWELESISTFFDSLYSAKVDRAW